MSYIHNFYTLMVQERSLTLIIENNEEWTVQHVYFSLSFSLRCKYHHLLGDSKYLKLNQHSKEHWFTNRASLVVKCEQYFPLKLCERNMQKFRF